MAKSAAVPSRFVFLLQLFGVLSNLSPAQGFRSTFHASSQRQISTKATTVTTTRTWTRTSTTTLHAKIPLLGRFRKKREVPQIQTIAVGDVIPDVDVEVVNFGTTKEETTTSTPMSIRQVLGEEGSAVLVGMPGAFTPTCSNEHLPGFISSVGKFQALGINKIVVMTTNDRYVNEEWGSRYNLFLKDNKSEDAAAADPIITIVSDGDGDLAKALGLADDMGFGVGVRSKRFAMVVTDGTVSTLLTDQGMSECSETSAQNLLRILTPDVPAVDENQGNSMTVALIGGGAALVLGLLLSLTSGSGSGSGDRPISAPAPKVQVQPAKQESKKESPSTFGLLNQYSQ